MKTILVKNIKMKTIKLDSDASKVCTIEQDFPNRMLELMVAFKSSLEENVSLNPVYSKMGKHIAAYNPCKTNHYFTEVATLSLFVGY